MTDDYFEKLNYQTKETRNNCLLSKKRNMTLRQPKTDKHDCCNITATSQILIRKT